jgi:hypothetical protein
MKSPRANALAARTWETRREKMRTKNKLKKKRKRRPQRGYHPAKSTAFPELFLGELLFWLD